MSAFDTGTQESTNVQESTSFLEQLVGEGKKFKDTEDLAKGKAEADRFIEELQVKNRDTESLKTRLDELIKKLEAGKSTISPVGSNVSGTPYSNTNGPSGNENTNSQNTERDIEALVKKALEADKVKTFLESNINKVDSVLTEKFGERAADIVNQKAKDLNMSVDSLKELAGKSPNAFLSLVVGLDDGTSKSTSAILQSTHNSEALGLTNRNNANERGWSYYQKLKKENSGSFYKRFHEIHDQVEKMGSDKFYNS